MDCDFDTGWRIGLDLCLVIEALVVGLPLASRLLACSLVQSFEFCFFVFSVVIFQRLNPNPIKMGPLLV